MKIRHQSSMQWFDSGIEYQFMFHLHHSHRLLKDSKPGFSTINDPGSTDTLVLRPVTNRTKKAARVRPLITDRRIELWSVET